MNGQNLIGGRQYGTAGNSQRQKVDTVEFDTLTWGASETLSSKEFFTNESKPKQYRSIELPTNLGRGYVFTHIAVSYNIIYDISGSKPPALDAGDEYFLNNSYIQYQIESKTYPRIPLVSIVSSVPTMFGGTLANQRKTSYWYKLGFPIVLPEAGNVSFELLTPRDLSTGATPEAYLPGLSLTSDVGNFVKIFMKGLVDRPVS